MSNEECVTKFYKGFPVSDRMLCAWKRSSAGKTIGDTCGGDSGGRRVLDIILDADGCTFEYHNSQFCLTLLTFLSIIEMICLIPLLFFFIRSLVSLIIIFAIRRPTEVLYFNFEKDNWRGARDSNPGTQDRRCRRFHWAMGSFTVLTKDQTYGLLEPTLNSSQ